MWSAKCQHNCDHHLLPNFLLNDIHHLQCCLWQWQSNADRPTLTTWCPRCRICTTYVCVMLMSLPLFLAINLITWLHLLLLTVLIQLPHLPSRVYDNFPHSHHHSATTSNYCQWRLNSPRQH